MRAGDSGRSPPFLAMSNIQWITDGRLERQDPLSSFFGGEGEIKSLVYNFGFLDAHL